MAIKSRASRKKKAKPNNVKTLRTDLGMFQNDLAREADVSVASIRGTESLTRDLSDALKSRIVYALSKKSEAKGKGPLDKKDIFPNS